MFGAAVQELDNVHLNLAGWIAYSESSKSDDLWFLRTHCSVWWKESMLHLFIADRADIAAFLRALITAK